MGVVFQYGSNTCTARLNAPSRLRGDATPIGKAQTVDDYEIFFNVFSQRNKCAASNICLHQGRKVWGILYEISEELISGKPKGRKSLRQIEGPKYSQKTIRVEKANGEQMDAITLLAVAENCQEGLSTAVWYVSWILYGLRSHGVDEDYIEHVRVRAIETNQQATKNAQAHVGLIREL